MGPLPGVNSTEVQIDQNPPQISGWAHFKMVAWTVTKVAGKIFLTGIFYMVFPNVVVIGFAVGFIFDQSIQNRIRDIQKIWNKLHPALKPVVGVGIGLVCFFAPITWPGLAFVYSAYIGSKTSIQLSEWAGWKPKEAH
jgi:hypothetical protein